MSTGKGDGHSIYCNCTLSSGLLVVSTSGAAISDAVMILWLSRDRKDRARSLGQRGRHDGDLQRRKIRWVNRSAINLK